MSWLSKGLGKLGNAIVHNPITEGSKKILKEGEKWVSSKVPHVHSEEKRAALGAAKEQIEFYKTAKEELDKQRTENETQKKEERQRINEKQIRAKQRTYKRGGFLEQPSSEPKDTLG